jgi:hypothetical protein
MILTQAMDTNDRRMKSSAGRSACLYSIRSRNRGTSHCFSTDLRLLAPIDRRCVMSLEPSYRRAF